MEIWTPSTTNQKRSLRSERDYQKQAISEWEALGGFAQNIHPTFGMKLGIPDAEFLVGPFLVPVEFKVGALSANCIEIKRIRPAQRGWHKSYRRSGGVSGIIVGTPDGIFTPTVDQFCSGRHSFETQEIKRFATYAEAVECISGPLQFLLR
jgi:hypothetical protein